MSKVISRRQAIPSIGVSTTSIVYGTPSGYFANASSRMCSIALVLFSRLAVVKSQAIWRSSRAIPALSKVANISSKCARRDSMTASSEGSSSRNALKPGEGATSAPSPSKTFRTATMYRVASFNRIAGRTMKACSSRSSATSRVRVGKFGFSSPASMRSFACTAHSSSSAQCGTRSPVSASMITVGDSASSESSIVSGDARPATVAPGKCVIAAIPGEKPSISLNAPGFDCCLFTVRRHRHCGQSQTAPRHRARILDGPVVVGIRKAAVARCQRITSKRRRRNCASAAARASVPPSPRSRGDAAVAAASGNEKGAERHDAKASG